MIENKGTEDYLEVMLEDTNTNPDGAYDIPKEVSETEAMIYDWVVDRYGNDEAELPSWNIAELAKYIDENRSKGGEEKYRQNFTVAYRI